MNNRETGINEPTYRKGRWADGLFEQEFWVRPEILLMLGAQDTVWAVSSPFAVFPIFSSHSVSLRTEVHESALRCAVRACRILVVRGTSLEYIDPIYLTGCSVSVGRDISVYWLYGPTLL